MPRIKPKKLDSVPAMKPMVLASLPVPAAKKTTNYLDEYKSWVYNAVSFIAEEVSTINLKLFKKKTLKGEVVTEEVYSHEALSLLDHVNDFTTRYSLFLLTQIYLDLAGEAFWGLVRHRQSGTPDEIWVLRPDWVKVVGSKEDFISHYIYCPWGDLGNEVKLERDDVIHFKSPHPKNPYRGKGVAQSQAMAIDIWNYLQEYERAFFFNSAIPSVVISTDATIGKREEKRWVTAWEQRHMGPKAAHKMALLSGGKWDTKVISPSLKDMDLINFADSKRDEILAAFKLSKANLGITTDVNRANAEAQDLRFKRHVVKPRMRALVGHLTEFLLPMYPNSSHLFFDFEDPVGPDIETEMKIINSGLGGDGNIPWMTPNEARDRRNLPPLKGGDNIYLPLTLQPSIGVSNQKKGIFGLFGKKKDVESGFVILEGKGAKPKCKHNVSIPHGKLMELKNKVAEKDLKKKIMPDLVKLISEVMVMKDYPEESKAAIWKNLIAKTNVWEAKYLDELDGLFNDQEREVVANARLLGKFLSKEKGWEKWLFNITKEVAKWKKIFVPLMIHIVESRGRDVLIDLGIRDELDLTADPVVRFLKKEGLEFIKGVNETTIEKLKKTLSEGTKQGEGIPKLTKRIQEVFAEASTSRAKKIARTEVMKAANSATQAAYIQSGIIDRNEWLAALDERTDPECVALNGEVVPVGKMFSAGVIKPPLHPNCRCTLVPVFEEKVVKPLTKKELKKMKKEVKELEGMRHELIKEANKVEKKIQEQYKELHEELPKQKRKIIERAIADGEKEKDKILSELAGLRDKARNLVENEQE